ncbi:hypothetical protein LCGC14_0706510 [marine sediment metagenome]|uniref:Uncharacterized protein n=1 Tax=marine sediment metagenome TaxID=412755 RepID=A0A0F9T256_9ZZZZ
MKNKKIFVLSISALLFMGIIFTASGYHEYIKNWEGPAHVHCSHDASIASVNGTISLAVNETGTLAPYQAFTLSIDVSNFSEALVDPFYGRIMLGVPGNGAGDNAKFSLPLGHQLLNRRESVDVWGSYNDDTDGNADNDNVFTLLAPGKAGNYTLMGLAIAGVNQSGAFADTVEHAEVNITYIEGTIDIEVVAPELPADVGGDGGAIPGGLLTVIIGSTFAASTILVLSIRKKLRKKEL